ncbi:pum, partial [Symbiodinium necroappetens]
KGQWPGAACPPDAKPLPGLKPGDWICPACGQNCFASKFTCPKCGRPKRGEETDVYVSEHGRIHPDIQELCDEFYIETRHIEKLNELMKDRHDTWVEDLKKLKEIMEEARSPCGMLVVKMKEMEDGTFVAINRDKRMQHLKEKFKLDRIAETRLSDILARCSDEKKDEYYHDLE